MDHISGAFAGTPIALDWMARRLGRGAVRQPPVEEVVEAPTAKAA
jgi:hypothetical protein